jgi:hypothetical protein
MSACASTDVRHFGGLMTGAIKSSEFKFLSDQQPLSRNDSRIATLLNFFANKAKDQNYVFLFVGTCGISFFVGLFSLQLGLL